MGSGPLLPSRGWPSSPSVTLWCCDPAVCLCLGGGGGGLQHSFEDVSVFAVGGGGGGLQHSFEDVRVFAVGGGGGGFGSGP